MKSVKKRIIAFMLCFMIVGSNVFFSYENALVVQAQDEYDLWDAINDILGIALVTVGIYTVVSTGGVTAPAVLEIGAGLVSSGIRADNIYDYIVNNGDGTYTMSEEFIDKVLAEVQRIEEEGFTAEDVVNQSSGMSYDAKVTGVSNCTHGCKLGTSCSAVFTMSVLVVGRSAVCFNPVSPLGNGERNVSLWYNNCNSSCGSPTHISWACGASTYNNSAIAFYAKNCGSNVPVFADQDAVSNYVKTGQGYKNALNYHEKPPFQYGSNYSPTYTGGAVRFSRGVLDGIVDKINEVDQKVDDIDQKLDELNDYIRNGGGAVDDDPYDDTETTTSTDGWLKKIYNKLVDIFKQIKSIRRWTIAGTIIDAADAIADWLSLIHDILEDVDNGAESAVATLSSALDDATGLLKKKFPFSVPWDILFVVTFFAAEPETPHFEMPIQMELPGLGIAVDYTFVLDFSEYEYLSKISRAVLSMTYAVGLLKLTAGVTSTKKEE